LGRLCGGLRFTEMSWPEGGAIRREPCQEDAETETELGDCSALDRAY